MTGSTDHAPIAMSFAPGPGIAIIGPVGVLFLPEPKDSPQLQRLVDTVLAAEESLAEAVTRVLLGGCEERWPSFALVDRTHGIEVAYVRGDVTVTAQTQTGTHELNGARYSTWLEHQFDSPVESMTIGHGTAASFFRVHGIGIVPASSVAWGGAVRTTPALTDAPDTSDEAYFTPVLGSSIQIQEPVSSASNGVAPSYISEPPLSHLSADNGTIASELPPVWESASPDVSVPGRRPSVADLFGDEQPEARPSVSMDAPMSWPPSAPVPVAPPHLQEDEGLGTARGDFLDEVRRQLSDVSSSEDQSVAGSLVRGRSCPAGHLNPPMEDRCLTCKVPIDLDGAIATGPRPRLGTLVFDDQSMVFLDRPVIIGRTPAGNEMIAGEVAQPVALDDSARKISSVHVVVRFESWEVIVEDRDSKNGTWVTFPGRDAVQLRPNVPTPIVPGTVVNLANRRTFTYREQ